MGSKGHKKARKNRRKGEVTAAGKAGTLQEESRPIVADTVKLALLIALVVVAVSAAHWPALSAQALGFDDHQYLVENPIVRNPSWSGAWRFLSEVLEPSTVQGYYQPLTMISLMADHAMGGRVEDLRAFHRTSLLLHLANTALIIILLFQLFKRPVPAALVGLLFGLHPMTVETIPWIGERKTLLAAFFALCCLLLYIRYARQNGLRWFGFCGLAYVLALMSKPTSTPLPVVMLLMDCWPLRRFGKRAILEKVPLFGIALISVVITMISQGRSEAGTTMPGEYSPARIPLTLCHNIVFYLYKMVWLTDYSSHYPIPDPLSLAHPMVLAGAIGTCILIPLLLISLRWTPAFLVGWLIFFVAIFPTLGVVGFTIVIASDKFAYLPSVGLLMTLTWLLGEWWGRARDVRHLRTWRVVIAVAVLAWAGAEARATRRYLAQWKDSETLSAYMLSHAPNAAVIHLKLGTIRGAQGHLDEAIECHEAAIRCKPDYLEAHYNLGRLLTQKGRLEQAVRSFEKAIELKPDYYKAYSDLGIALARQGKLDKAMAAFARALECNPDFSFGHNNLAIILSGKGRIDEAIEHYQQAIALDPSNFRAHSNIGPLLVQQGKIDEAINHYAAALRIAPSNVPTWLNLGDAHRARGELREAVEAYQQALRLDPQDARAKHELTITRRQLQP
jgi:tetratricopeptide (TPR) repeat protein